MSSNKARLNSQQPARFHRGLSRLSCGVMRPYGELAAVLDWDGMEPKQVDMRCNLGVFGHERGNEPIHSPSIKRLTVEL
ncbi:hypothetical protein PSTG_20072, partial [Puccinia striiformis f. sp. tritici PST-78]